MENKRTGVVQCPKCDDRFTRENGELVLIASSTSTTSTTTSSSSNTSSTTSSTPPNNIVRPATKSASAVMVRPSVPMSNIHFYLISNVNSKGSIAFERLDDVTRLVSGVWHAIDAPSDQSRRALLCHLQRHCYRSISKARINKNRNNNQAHQLLLLWRQQRAASAVAAAPSSARLIQSNSNSLA
jgi:hypothetical protein